MLGALRGVPAEGVGGALATGSDIQAGKPRRSRGGGFPPWIVFVLLFLVCLVPHVFAHIPLERTYAWDDRARTLTETDANGKVTKFWYNLYGQDVRVERRIHDTSRYVAEYRYDNFGNPVWVKAPDGDTTGHSYDWGNRVRRSRYPEGIEVRRSFDWQGLPRRVVQTGKTWSAGTAGTSGTDITTLTYDALGRTDSVQVQDDPRMGVRAEPSAGAIDREALWNRLVKCVTLIP